MDIQNLLQDDTENHAFNVSDAKKYGIECAVLLFHIKHWIKRNIFNEKHFYNGNYWTYNSVKALCALFPYFTKDQIRRYLDKLVELGVLEKGNFNQNPYDRTTWYAISAWRKCFLDLAETQNTIGKNAKSYNEADTITDTKKINKKNSIFADFNETATPQQPEPKPQTTKESPKTAEKKVFNGEPISQPQNKIKTQNKDYYRDFSDLVPRKNPEKEAAEFKKMCEQALNHTHTQTETETEDYPDYEPTLFV